LARQAHLIAAHWLFISVQPAVLSAAALQPGPAYPRHSSSFRPVNSQCQGIARPTPQHWAYLAYYIILSSATSLCASRRPSRHAARVYALDSVGSTYLTDRAYPQSPT